MILDWAGTAVDHGSLAPVRTLQSLFAARGTPVTEEEARRDMGIHKKDHIRALLRVKTGEAPDEAEVENVFRAFIPMQMDCLAAYSAVIPGVPAAVAVKVVAPGVEKIVVAKAGVDTAERITNKAYFIYWEP